MAKDNKTAKASRGDFVYLLEKMTPELIAKVFLMETSRSPAKDELRRMTETNPKAIRKIHFIRFFTQNHMRMKIPEFLGFFVP